MAGIKEVSSLLEENLPLIDAHLFEYFFGSKNPPLAYLVSYAYPMKDGKKVKGGKAIIIVDNGEIVYFRNFPIEMIRNGKEPVAWLDALDDIKDYWDLQIATRRILISTPTIQAITREIPIEELLPPEITEKINKLAKNGRFIIERRWWWREKPLNTFIFGKLDFLTQILNLPKVDDIANVHLRFSSASPLITFSYHDGSDDTPKKIDLSFSSRFFVGLDSLMLYRATSGVSVALDVEVAPQQRERLGEIISKIEEVAKKVEPAGRYIMDAFV